MTSIFERIWADKTQRIQMPRKFTGIDHIYYDELEYGIKHGGQKFADRIVDNLVDGKILLIKNCFDLHFVKKLKSTCIEFWKSTPDTYFEMKEGCPDFHRVITPELAKNYSVGAVRHSTYFFRWNNNLSEFWPDITDRWRNMKYISGLGSNAYELNTPKDVAIDRSQIVCYPPKFGGVETHIDSDGNCRLAISCYLSSINNGDFSTGGFYVIDSKDERVNLEPFIEAGDFSLYYPMIEHGVTPIDVTKNVDKHDYHHELDEYDWYSGKGRWWMGLFSPDSNEITNRTTSSSLGNSF